MNIKEQKAVQAEELNEESNELQLLASMELLAAWKRIQYVARLAKLAPDERVSLTVASLFSLAAEVSVELGLEREDFLKEMGAQFDDAIEGFTDEPIASETMTEVAPS